MPAIRLLDTEHQTELAYLHEQLIEGEPVQDKSWRYAEEYLMQLGIYNVILVEENDVRNYKRFLLEDRDCTIRAANSMTSFLRNKKAYWIEQEYGDLLEEIRQCEGIEMPLTGNIKNFLIREGIHHIREIDYSIREKYEQYLMKEKKPEQVLRYLKTLDRIKQYHIRQEMKQFANIKKFYLKYEQQILFLPYLPDQKLAMEFDKVRDKTELVWDFSVKASEKMKQQIFQLLIHILENVKDPKDRRVRFLLPMQWMYQYCIKQGIVDIETIEQEEIEKLEEIVKQKVVNYKNSMQIVDNSRKILFMSGKQIHWHANVWYMERFHLAPERVNPCNPVNRLSFYQVENLNNRKLLQEYARYQIGITGLTIGNIRSQQNYVKKFLKYLGPDVCALDVTEKQIGAYFKEIQQQEIQAETVNRQILDITKFYEYLKIKKHIKAIPFHPEYYEQKVYPIHHDRSVDEDIYREILHKLNLFPEELRLIFLHLWATGLRISEVCTLKGDAYYWDGARETPALERKLRQILKFAEVKDEREEQEKDIWELEKFEFPIRRNPIKNVKTLNFTDILQPDIREEVKRTIFLHLKYSALGTIHSEMTAVKRFSRFLNVRKPELESLQELSREDIEDYLIYLQTETTERKNYRSDLYGLKRVIEDVGNIYERRHLLQLFLNNDFPSTPRYQFKFYSDATIKRLNSHIFNMDEQIARALIVHQLLGTRISDTLTLRMDCLREKEGRYFVRIDQVKSITYEKAVSNEVGRLILKAMEYTKERYGETEYVFVKKDDPTKPYQYGMIQAQVMRMIRQKDIRDDNGELLKFGTHIFRHCYGKKLTELHIEDWMIARLLGHKTLQSVHHYRRIGNKVMADETRKTREKMDLILMDIIKGWDGYEL